MAQGELSLADYWRILRRRKWIIAAGMTLVTGVAVFFLKRQVPVYRVTAKIKIETSVAASANLFQGLQTSYENPMTTESRVIESRIVAEEVASRLEPELAKTNPDAFQNLIDDVQGDVKAEAISETNIIKIMITGSDPKRITKIANLVAEAYIETNLSEKNKQARKVREFVESQLAQTDGRLTASEDALKHMREAGTVTGTAVVLQGRIADLETQLANLLPKLTEAHPEIIRLKELQAQLQEQLKVLPEAELEYARLDREMHINEKTYGTLRERLEEARITEAEKISNASIIERARLPLAPLGAPKRFGVVVGAILGLLLGCVFAFVVETLDTSIGTIEDVETLLKVPVLAVIPHVGLHEEEEAKHQKSPRRRWTMFWKRKQMSKDKQEREDRAMLPAHFQPHSITAEAYRILRTNLKLLPEQKVILVTSAGPGEGKTSIASNLAVVAAQSGARTVLVAADLRRPQLAHIFGLPHNEGLTEVLLGTLPLDRVLRGLSDFILGKFGFDETVKHPYLANLFILTSGRLPENPAELIGSKAMQALLMTLRQKFDVVIIDSPPLLPVTDSLLLAPKVDGVALVYQVGRISRAALLRAKIQLESVGTKILGVVLNHVQPEVQTDPHYYYYAYRKRYGYTTAQESPTPPSTPSPQTPTRS